MLRTERAERCVDPIETLVQATECAYALRDSWYQGVVNSLIWLVSPSLLPLASIDSTL